jgi:hypothetical protein
MRGVLVILGMNLLTGCAPGASDNNSVRMLAVRFQATLDTWARLRRDLVCPEHFMKPNATRTGGEFDAHSYFTVLKHIQMQEGYVLDYVYAYRNLGGHPILYARRTEQTRYATEADFKDAIRARAHLDEVEKAYEEYRTALQETDDLDPERLATADDRLEERLADFPNHEYWEWYLEHVQIDGSKEGYLEFVALHLLGDQFYLYWHANYHDTRIIADKSALDDLFGQAFFLDHKLPQSLRAEAERLDYSPQVEITESQAKVSIVTFSKWGGFQREHFIVDTRFPHRIVADSKETLISYFCDMWY